MHSLLKKLTTTMMWVTTTPLRPKATGYNFSKQVFLSIVLCFLLDR